MPRSLTLAFGALALFVCLAILGPFKAAASGNGEPPETHVNGSKLEPGELARFAAATNTERPIGRYWYDPVSGLWGREGGPALGQIAAGLDLGGSLHADASGGTTKVFINGRAIHAYELASLQRLFCHVLPGRYWLRPDGIGGLEGGPPSFNLLNQPACGHYGAPGDYSYRNSFTGSSETEWPGFRVSE